MLARYRESGLKATQLTPKECSAREVKGVSEGASVALEKMSIRGLYPVYARVSKCGATVDSMDPAHLSHGQKLSV